MPAQSWGDAERRATTTGGDISPDQVIGIQVDLPAPETVVVRVSGEIDMFTTPTLQAALEKQLARETCGLLIVDMQDVTFLASNGLAALVEARRQAEVNGTALRLVGHSRAVTRPLESTGLYDMFELYDEVDKALAPQGGLA